MVVVSRRASLLIAFATLGGSVTSGANDVAASSPSTLLRASSDDVEALGGQKGKGISGGDVTPLGHRSHSNHYRGDQVRTVIGGVNISFGGACPSDYILSNNQCIRTGPSDISCPEGFTEEESAFPGTTPEVIFRNRTCALFEFGIEPDVSCAAGSLDGVTCFEFSAVAPIFTGCDPGFELTPRGCIANELTPIQPPRCESGELGPGNGCFDVTAVAATLVCAGEGFIGEDGVTCVTRTVVGAATTGCPNGFEIGASSSCVKRETSGTVPSCEGLPGQLQGGQCVEFEAVAAAANCGEGFDLVNNSCVAFVSQAPEFTCPQGFSSVSDLQCEREIRAPPVAQCPIYEAFFDAELQECLVITQGPVPTLECEEGAVIQDGACAFVQVVAADLFCAEPGFILTNTPSGDAQVCQQCTSTGIIGGGISLDDTINFGGHHGHRAHKHTVEEGMEEGDESVKPNTAEEAPTNVRGLQTKEEDEKVDEEEHVPGQAPPIANATTYHHHHGHHGEGNSIIDTGLGGGETFACTTLAPAFQCPTGFVASSAGADQCIQIDAAAGIQVCVSGFTLSSDQTSCELRAQSPATFSCDSGYNLSADSSTCILRETEPKTTTCPAGSDLVGDTCVNVRITQAAQLTCGPGRELQDGQCIAAAAVAAAFGCPEGFSFGQGETTCTRTTTIPGQKGCTGEGTFLEGGQCVRYPGVASTATCAEGDVLTDGQCQTFQLIAPAVVCAAGFTQVDGQCVKEEFALPDIECPVGSFIQDGGCVTASGVAAQATCPDGLVAVRILEDTAFGCFSLALPFAICPLGQELTIGDECIITSIAPNTTPTLPNYSHFGGHHGGAHGHNKAHIGGHSQSGDGTHSGDHH